MQLAAEPESFGTRLLEWVTAQRSAEPGFLEDVAWHLVVLPGLLLLLLLVVVVVVVVVVFCVSL